ncbi:MAG: hypothetical protein M3209_04450 [Acidobacteriota bacterium]|nr:hypothetical protein [Acidobacteriota bacterium]
MRRKDYLSIVLVFFILLVFQDIHAQQAEIFSEAKGTPTAAERIYDYEKWNFSIDNNQYEIKKNGKAKRIDEKNRVTNFYINLKDADNLVRIYFAQYKNDLILLCEDEAWDAGGGFIIRLDGKILKPKWREHIPAFNIARGLIEGNSAYLAAIGFAAKINLDTGKYIWKHDNFYRRYKEDGAFTVFDVPEIQEETIVFTEKSIYDRPPNIIKFNKNSGDVIQVSVN